MATFGRGLERVIVKITDLSLEGVRLTSPIPVLPGTHIWLKMPLLACREAVVVWCNGSQIGCEFSNPLHPMMFETLTKPRCQDETLMPGRRANNKVAADLDPKPGKRKD
jgi:hypothetical protein